MALTLGLDLGTNSIGWALVDQDDKESRLKACGVRIFQEVVDAQTRTPKNQARRNARLARRLVARRRRRREKLLKLLVENGLLPPDVSIESTRQNDRTVVRPAGDEQIAPSSKGETQEDLFNKLGDPYELRRKGLDEALSPYEIGRVLYHLAHRRGFLSNRRAKPREEGEIRHAIRQLEAEIKNAGCRTLGEFLALQKKKRGRYTSRELYEQEFEVFWDKQARYHPTLLTHALKAAVRGTIFHQRQIKVAKWSIGMCTFERRKPRAARAWPDAQRFRLLTDLNHLRVKSPTTLEYRELGAKERETLLHLLEKQERVSWDRARQALGLHNGEVFNLEEGNKPELSGDRTGAAIRKVIGRRWDEFTKEERHALVCDLLTIDSESGLLRRLKNHWNLDDRMAEKLAKVEMEPGYVNLSLKAIRKILPYLEQGLTYDKACAAAGYHHANSAVEQSTAQLGPPPQVRNPVVQKALFETRKVVNAIVRRYGRPAVICVEMARDLKLTRKQKEALAAQNKHNERLNREAKEALQAMGVQNPSHDDKVKYRLWKECKAVCPYTGQPISLEMLFSGDVDVEHILPYSRTLDDSYMNKTLCFAEENRLRKHNKTPYEAYSGTPALYEAILQRVRILPWPKRRRFEQKAIDTDEFISRQLNDTRYICREVKDYLKTLGVSVRVSKGEATAWLRYVWGLNRILGADGSAEKNRADHRHHAVDAVVVAMTDHALLHRISVLAAHSRGATSPRRLQVEPPWPGFYKEVEEKIKGIVVSHAPLRKIRGAFHLEKAYGYDEQKQIYLRRIPLNEKINDAQIDAIHDKKVKELVKAHLQACGGDKRQAFGDRNNPVRHVDGVTPIRKVRIEARFDPARLFSRRDHDDKAYQFFPYDNNHHVEIIEHRGTGKRKGIFVTTMEAARRARIAKIPIVQRTPPWTDGENTFGDDWEFKMSLGINDLVRLEVNGETKLMRVQKLDASNERVIFRDHTDAETDRTREHRKNVTVLRCTKLRVDPLGTVWPAHD